MMYGHGTGGWWMLLMPLAWIANLHRRYAQGEVDDAYATARSS